MKGGEERKKVNLQPEQITLTYTNNKKGEKIL